MLETLLQVLRCLMRKYVLLRIRGKDRNMTPVIIRVILDAYDEGATEEQVNQIVREVDSDLVSR